MILTSLEQTILLEHEDDFNTLDINKALCNVIDDIYSLKWRVAHIGSEDLDNCTIIEHILSFLSEGSNLLNEIDDTPYNCILKNAAFYSKKFRVPCGPDKIVNDKLTVAWIQYGYGVKSVDLPNAIEIPSLYLVSGSRSDTRQLEYINIPSVVNIPKYFDLLPYPSEININKFHINCSSIVKDSIIRSQGISKVLSPCIKVVN